MTPEEYTTKIKEYEGEYCSKCSGRLVYDPDNDILVCDGCGWEYFLWDDGSLGCI